MSRQRMGHKPIEEFIEFQDAGTSPSGKTRRWHVVNTMNPAEPDYFGEIRWHGAWRKYIFECGPSFYDWDCLRHIANFIEKKTLEHRKSA